MIHVGKQWCVRALSLCVVGPIAAGLAGGLRADDGAQAASFLTSVSSIRGMIFLLLITAFVTSVGVIAGRMVDRREGFLSIGLSLGWVAWSMGRLGDAYQLNPEAVTLIKLLIEGAALSGIVLLGMVAMTDPSKGGVQGNADEVSRFDIKAVREQLVTQNGFIVMLVSLVAGLAIAFLFGRTDMPGQSLGVGFFAGIGGGLAGALTSGSLKKDQKTNEPTSYVPLMVGVILCAILAPAIGFAYPGVGKLLGQSMDGSLPGMLNIAPVAWVAGAILGVPIGHSWVEQTAQHATGVNARA